jgi:YVTN family beta-propeller protein
MQWFDPEPQIKGLAFAKKLRDLGNEVEVLTGFPNYPGGVLYPGYSVKLFQIEIIDGIRIMRVPLYPSHDTSPLRRILNYVSFGFSSFLGGLLFVKRPDVIYACGPPVTVGVGAAVISDPRESTFDPINNRIYVTSYSGNSVSVIDTLLATSGIPYTLTASTISVGTNPSSISYDVNTGRVFVLNETDNTISVIDSFSNTVTNTISGLTNITKCVVNTNNNTLYVLRGPYNEVLTYNTISLSSGTTISVGDLPRTLTFDSTYVYVGNYNDDTISVINASTNTVVKTNSVSPKLITGLTVDTNKNSLYMTSQLNVYELCK